MAILTAIGAITLAVLAFLALRQIWKDIRSKSTPWFWKVYRR